MNNTTLFNNCVKFFSSVDYYAHAYKVVRHEPVHFHKAIQIQHLDIHERLLPIISDSRAASGSPLAEYVHPERDEPLDLVIPPTASTENLEHTSDVVSHLLNPAGPWYLRFNVPIPGCDSGIHFTNKGHGTRTVVAHRLKVKLRVAAGLAERIASNERLKLYDIIIEAPIHLLSVRLFIIMLPCADPPEKFFPVSLRVSQYSFANIFPVRGPNPVTCADFRWLFAC